MSDDICIYCGGPKAVRNPTGKCDHLYWPDMIPGAAKDANITGELAAARSAALEEAAKVAEGMEVRPVGEYSLGYRSAVLGVAAAIRELKGK